MKPREKLSLAQTRRVVLAAQGFAEPRSARVDRRHVRRVFNRVGVVQIDSVNVLVRSHYLPLFSRLGPYPRALLETTAYGRRHRELFEYWGHEASFLPLRLHPLLRWRMERARRGEGTWGRVAQIVAEKPALVASVRAAIVERGPLGASDFEGARNRGPWWGWSDTKAALEYLFWSGEITTARRRNFERLYDLTERVLSPDIVASPTPSEADAQRELLRIAIRACGVATESDLRDYFRLSLADARARLRELLEAGEIVPVAVEGWNATAYVGAELAIPRGIAASALLSPFDSLVWERGRTRRLFGFDYRIEIYVPAQRRIHGYYVLPFLCRERLCARVDLKSDRERKRLLVRNVHFEEGATADEAIALRAELAELAAWLELESVDDAVLRRAFAVRFTSGPAGSILAGRGDAVETVLEFDVEETGADGVERHAMLTVDHVTEFVRANRERYLDELKVWIACPSVSADPGRHGEVRRSAETVVARMSAAGLTETAVLETDGLPIAYGSWLHAPGAPTVLIYGHHDVQPEDPLGLWESPPFEGTVREGKLFGRGSVDDKGQVLMHLAALEAHLRVNGKLPINVKVVVEGEEEIGSPSFEAFLAREKERLACDVVVVSDTAVFAEDVPSLTVSLRGLVHWDVTVHGPASDLHSGSYGGAVVNPIEALARMIATLRDDDGRIAVPGFYDGVRELAASERVELESLPFDAAHEARVLGVEALMGGERDRSPLERMWFRPTLELNGIYGGYQGPGGKTIVPSFAHAKISARLVADQDPAHVRRVVREHLERVAPPGVRVEMTEDGDTRAVSTSREHPAVVAAARAMERGFGKPPVFIGSGGTIGPVSSFDRILHLPQVLIGVGLPDDAIHAPNEKFDLAQFYGGIETMTYLYDELARVLEAVPR